MANLSVRCSTARGVVGLGPCSDILERCDAPAFAIKASSLELAASVARKWTEYEVRMKGKVSRESKGSTATST